MHSATYKYVSYSVTLTKAVVVRIAVLSASTVRTGARVRVVQSQECSQQSAKALALLTRIFDVSY